MEIIGNMDEREAREAAERALGASLAKAHDKAILLLLSGGSAFDILSGIASAQLGPRVTIGMLDERFDPSPAVNNFLQFQKTDFYRKAREKDVRFIESVPRDGESLADFAGRMEMAWREWREKNTDGRVIITQGIGPDGHTAGVMPFPEDAGLFAELFRDEERWVRGDDAGAKNQYPQRATATLSFLKTHVYTAIVYMVGEAKQSALERVLSDKGALAETPARIAREMRNALICTDLNDQDKTSRKKALIPTTIVIFGITGDLAKRKLIPALWHLFVKGYLPDTFSIIGFSRREWSDDALRAYVEDILKENMIGSSPEARADFLTALPGFRFHRITPQ